LAAGVKGFGAVEADRLDSDADFAGFGLAGGMVLELESRGTGELVEAHNLGHGVLLLPLDGRVRAEGAGYEAGAWVQIGEKQEE
jgi:hypothetical protein